MKKNWLKILELIFWKSQRDLILFFFFFIKKQQACLHNRNYYFPVTHTPAVKMP